MAEREKTFATVVDKYLHDLAVTRWQWRKAKEGGVETEIADAKATVDEIWIKRSEPEITQGLQERRTRVPEEAAAPTIIPLISPRIEARPEDIGEIAVRVAAEKAPRIEKEKGKVFIFPDGKKVADLTAKESQILAQLHFSPDEALLSSDLAISIYDKKVPIRTGRQRINAWLTLVNKKLREVGWQIVNVTPLHRGKEAKYNLAPIEEKPTKEKEEGKTRLTFFKEENSIELEERTIRLTPVQFKILEVLAKYADQPVISRQLSQEALGEPDPCKARLREYISRLRKEVNQPGRQEFLISEMRAHGSWYMLRGVEVVWPEEVKPVQVEERPVVEVEEEKPSMPPDWKQEAKLTPLELKIAEGLESASKDNPITSSKLIRFLYGKELALDVARGRFSVAISKFRRKIEDVGVIIVNIVPREAGSKGEEAQYYIASKGKVEVVSESQKRKKLREGQQVFEIPLPDGQVAKIKGRLKSQLLEKLLQTSQENQIATDELARIFYGSYTQKAHWNVKGLIERLRNDLKFLNWQIVQTAKAIGGNKGIKGQYYLEKVTEVPPAEKQPAVEEAPTEQITAEIGGVPAAVVEAPSVEPAQEVIIRPYEPTGEEKRSEEETKILEVIVTSLLSSARLRFDELQRQLYLRGRDKQVLGGKMYFIYQPQELKDKFVLAFTKMREEAEIAHLREVWSEAEKALWEKVQSLQQRLSGYDIEDFKRKVKLEIDRAERQFYRDNPPGSGREVVWVRRGHESRR